MQFLPSLGFPGSCHNRRQMFGIADGPRPNNCPGNPSRLALLAVTPQQFGQLLDAGPVDQIVGRQRLLPIHAHIQRAPAQERKTPLGPLELQAAHAEVASRPASGGSRNCRATSSILENRSCTRITLSPNGARRSRATASASASRSRPTSRPVVSRRAISTAWPPVPTVAST